MPYGETTGPRERTIGIRRARRPIGIEGIHRTVPVVYRRAGLLPLLERLLNLISPDVDCSSLDARTAQQIDCANSGCGGGRVARVNGRRCRQEREVSSRGADKQWIRSEIVASRAAASSKIHIVTNGTRVPVQRVDVCIGVARENVVLPRYARGRHRQDNHTISVSIKSVVPDVDVINARTIRAAVPGADNNARRARRVTIFDNVVADYHVMCSWLPRLRERFEAYCGLIHEIPLYDIRSAAIYVDGYSPHVVPDGAIRTLDADVLQLVMPKCDVVCSVVGGSTIPIRVMDIVVLNKPVCDGTTIEGQRLAVESYDVSYLVPDKCNVVRRRTCTYADGRKPGCPIKGADIPEIQELVVVEFDIARPVFDTQPPLQGAKACKVLERESLDPDIALATNLEQRGLAGVGAQVGVIEDDLVAPTSDARVAAAATRRNAEVVGLERDVVARSARNIHGQLFLVGPRQNVDGRAGRSIGHRVLNRLPRC